MEEPKKTLSQVVDEVARTSLDAFEKAGPAKVGYDEMKVVQSTTATLLIGEIAFGRLLPYRNASTGKPRELNTAIDVEVQLIRDAIVLKIRFTLHDGKTATQTYRRRIA